MSFVFTQTFAVYVPGFKLAASKVTVTGSLPPGGVVPESGFSDSHGTSLGDAHWPQPSG